MADPLEVFLKILLHLDGYPVLQQFISLSQNFRRQLTQALFGIFAIGRAAEVHLGIHQFVAAFLAAASGLVLEELH
jgi:hypothetical protein